MFLFNKVATIQGVELIKLLSSKPVIIDVREANEFAGGHIPGAKNIPLAKIDQYDVKTKEKLYVVCQSGMRSKRAVEILTKKGYEALNLKNGMIGWTGPVK